MSAAFHGWVMVVEYLESTMSKELLCKFPDNSAYDFDYSQSSIWSPLVPRHFSSDDNSSSESVDRERRVLQLDDDELLSRKLVYNEEKGLTKIKKFSANVKRKFVDMVFDKLPKCQKMKKKKKRRNSLDFSPISAFNKFHSSTPTPKKGWEKLLKAASKHFKKKNKKKDSIAHVDFSNYA